jgi:uncharacterized protein (DUF427 family)
MFSSQPIEPSQGQESVWDYPRPPRLEATNKRLQIIFREIAIVDSQRGYRVLETSHPPVYYIPPEDIQMQYLEETQGQSFCEWKGLAQYYNLAIGDFRVPKAAWYYPNPTPAFQAIANYVAFYADPMDDCYVNGEKVRPQPGGFYGGWITNDIVGPFKGELGTWGW